jgi:uncharacterized protein YbjQ (UPF0145 family)
MNTFSFFAASVLGLVVASATGCAATSLNPAAARVMVTKTPAPQGCVYIGSVVGEQGGAISGRYTSNANLAEGAFNDMKNKAYAMGANYVVLENSNAGNTVSGDRNGMSGAQTDVTHIGNAFKCADPNATVTTSGAVPVAPTTQPAATPAAPPASAPAASTPGRPSAANDVVIVVM